MEDLKEKVGSVKEHTQNLTDHVTDLLESYYKLGVLTVTEKATGIASFTVTLIAVSSLFIFTLLFIGLGTAWWLGEKLQNMMAGFFIVAASFALLIGIIMVFRKKLLFPFIRNIIIKNVYE